MGARVKIFLVTRISENKSFFFWPCGSLIIDVESLWNFWNLQNHVFPFFLQGLSKIKKQLKTIQNFLIL